MKPLFKRDRFFIPAGKCPVDLEGTDAETVRQWCLDVAEALAPDRPGSSTLEYYARQYYYGFGDARNPEAYEEVCGHIRAAFGLARELPPEPLSEEPAPKTTRTPSKSAKPPKGPSAAPMKAKREAPPPPPRKRKSPPPPPPKK